MASIEEIVSNLEFGRAQIFEAVAGLSQRELTEIPIYEGWTVRDVLVHLVGWDQWVLAVLPLILQNRADEIEAVDRDERNRQVLAQWRGRKLAEVLTAVRVSHRQVMDLICTLDHVEIDTRRERGGRIITIRSYIIDLTVDHERQHAIEIKRWRETMLDQVDPPALKALLAQYRTEFMSVLSGLSEAEVLDQTAVGTWSIKDIVGHVADWERLMLLAAQHIYDPSRPVVTPVEDGNVDDVNHAMAENRAGQSWSEVVQSLHHTQATVDAFIGRLTPGDWKLRGPYPWPNDQGSLAELIWHIATHYVDHFAAVRAWRERLS